MPEVTGRSVFWGTLLCVIFTIASVYSGLKVGQVMEAAIPISILAIGLARMYPRRSTILENVIITGIGGVSGSVVAGAIFTLPALYILNLDPNPLVSTFICMAGGCLGVLFLIPLRRYFVRDMHGKYPYPEATAITEVLVTGEKGGSQAKLLLQSTFIAGIYDFFATTFHLWKEVVNFRFIPLMDRLATNARVALFLRFHRVHPRARLRDGAAFVDDSLRGRRPFQFCDCSVGVDAGPELSGHGGYARHDTDCADAGGRHFQQVCALRRRGCHRDGGHLRNREVPARGGRIDGGRREGFPRRRRITTSNAPTRMSP